MRIVISSFTIVTLLSSNFATADPMESQQSAQTFEGTIPVRLRYLLYQPQDLESREKWPLILFLHGAGERGDDLQNVAKHGPPMMIQNGHQFPCFVVSPQCPSDRWWNPFELEALLNHIEETYPIDPDRIYVTGLSMGGYGTWELLGYMPDRIAAAIPICGGGVPYRARLFAKKPVWAFHGEEDEAVPLKRSVEMIEAMKAEGGTPHFTIYPDVGHDSWKKAYENPELFEWLFDQRLENGDSKTK